MISVNVNDYVKVRLTDVGVKELQRQHSELLKEFPNIDEFKRIKVDSDGYSRFQIHDLMRKFGHMMSVGLEPPFDTNVIFEEYKQV